MAEDRLSAEDFDDVPDEERHEPEDVGDDTALMQRGGGRPPWERRWWEKTPPRERSGQHGPRRRRSGARTRSRSRQRPESAERRDRATSAHRPWRTMTRFDAAGRREASHASTAACPSGARAGSRTGHPARVELPQGPSNLGIHAWHAILDMVDPMTAPENITYGMVAHQMDNLEATLVSMNAVERTYMLCSFLRMLSLLVTDVADVAERILAAKDVVEVVPDADGEEDGTSLMERYVVSKAGDASGPPTRSSASLVQQVFQAPAEMELRALVSALELGDSALPWPGEGYVAAHEAALRHNVQPARSNLNWSCCWRVLS